MKIKPIAYIENDFKDKFAVPRQSGIADIKSKIVLEKEYGEVSLRGIEGFSHLWLIWGFSENEGKSKKLTVRPPRLGGNKRVGVFASRSPFRPNGLGLSCVKLDEVKIDSGHAELIVSGADLIDGTPIYDIKPYIKYSDSHPEAECGFVDEREFNILNVDSDNDELSKIPEEKREVLITILKNDPRPAYQSDPERIYGFRFSNYEIKFKVNDKNLEVVSVERQNI